mgnify:CR=1 FL=1
MTIALLARMFMAVRRKIAQDAFLVRRISVFARDSRDVREKRDWSEVSSSRVAPVAHVLLVSLTTP